MSYDQHPWEREDEEIRQAFAQKDAEIERLKDQGLRVTELYGAAVETLVERDKLITELCDALTESDPYTYHGSSDLLQRAREATR
jgi:hypothetical protein